MTPAEQQRYQEMLHQAAINDPQARMHAAAFIKTATGKNLRDVSPSTLAPLMSAFFQMSPTIQGLTGAPQSPYGYAAPYVAALNSLASRGTVNVLSQGANGALISNNVLANSHTIQDATTGFVAQMLKPYESTHGVRPYSGISSAAAGSLVGMYLRDAGVSMYQQQANSNAAGLRAQLENLRNSANGIVKGGIEDMRLTRLVDARENLDIAAILRERKKKSYIEAVIKGEKVRKYLSEYEGKDDVARARAMRRDLLSQGGDVDFYAKLNESEKRMVVNMMRENNKLTKTESGDQLTETDISQAQHIAEGKGVLTHIGKSAEAAAAAAAKRAASVIKEFSGIFGTDDPNSIQAALHQINVGSILTEKGVEEAQRHLRETRVLAARTGQDVAEIIKAQVNVARMMSPLTSAETIRDITAFSIRTAQSYANNPDAYVNKMYTAEERQAEYLRARANEQNSAKGVGFARLAMAHKMVSSETEAKMKSLIEAYNNAQSPAEQARISDELTRLAADAGVDVNNKKIQEESASYITQAEVRRSIKMKRAHEIRTLMNARKGTELDRLVSGAFGSMDAAEGDVRELFDLTAGYDGATDLVNAIANGDSIEKITQVHGAVAGKYAQALRDRLTSEQLHALRAVYHSLNQTQTVGAANRNDIGAILQDRQMQAEAANRAAAMDRYRRNGDELDQAGAIAAFTAGLLGQETIAGGPARAMLYKTNAAVARKLMSKTGGDLALAIAGAIGDGSLQAAAANYFFSDEGNQNALNDYLLQTNIDRKNISDPKKYREAYWGAMQAVMEQKGFSSTVWINKIKEGRLSLVNTKDGIVASDATWNRIARTLGYQNVEDVKKMSWDELITSLAETRYGDPMLEKAKDGSEQAMFMTDEVADELIKASHHKIKTRYKNLDEKFKANLQFDGAGNIIGYIDKNKEWHRLAEAKQDTKTDEYIIQDAEGKQELRIKEDAKTGSQSWKVVAAAKESKTEEEQRKEEAQRKEEEQKKEEEKKKEAEAKEARDASRSLLQNVATMIDEFLSGSKVPKVKVANTEDFKK